MKRALLEKVDALRRPGSIVSSNTSGIPIAALAEGRSDDFRRHWLGTHFFNPPRYLQLLEVIPGPDTLPAGRRRRSGDFADHRLGKGVVLAKDSPNFIGNHIALYGVMRILEKVAAGEYTIEEVDAITGPAARPAEERHVPDARSRRPRHPRPRRRQPARTARRRGGQRVGDAGVRDRDARARADRREGRAGLLQAREEGRTASPRS